MRAHRAMSLQDVVGGAIGPFDDYCDGYGNPGSSGPGYISVVKLSTGMVAGYMGTASPEDRTHLAAMVRRRDRATPGVRSAEDAR